jgi:hypothetical protein
MVRIVGIESRDLFCSSKSCGQLYCQKGYSKTLNLVEHICTIFTPKRTDKDMVSTRIRNELSEIFEKHKLYMYLNCVILDIVAWTIFSIPYYYLTIFLQYKHNTHKIHVYSSFFYWESIHATKLRQIFFLSYKPVSSGPVNNAKIKWRVEHFQYWAFETLSINNFI